MSRAIISDLGSLAILRMKKLVVTQGVSPGNYLLKGYCCFTDNFHTSLHLAKAFLKQNTYLTGTIGHNRKVIPPEAKEAIIRKANYMVYNIIL
jgi:hypothetical protein